MKRICMVVCMAASALHAGSATGEFRLVEGHAGRRELCFAVRAPGNIRVHVESDAPGTVLHATLVHGTDPMLNVQGGGVLDGGFTVTPEHVTHGQEWAVQVQAVTPGQQGKGHITVSFPDGVANVAHELDAWLLAHPAIGLHLHWTDAQGTRSYSAWPLERRQRLWRFFDLTRAGQPPVLPDPPRNAWVFTAEDAPDAMHQLLTPQDAADLFLATVAHSLVMEIGQRVPWSLADLHGGELDAIFAGSHMFWWDEHRGGYQPAGQSGSYALSALPQVAWQFMQSGRLVGRNRPETITALVGWCRSLVHFTGALELGPFEDHWGYRGAMPVSRVLSGTTRQSDGKATRYTAGCHGTVGLLVSVLRSVNIPAHCRIVDGHATIIFLSEDRALTHGDDPYNRLSSRAPTEALLVDLATYNRWLGPLADPTGNIGRQTIVLGLQHLSPSTFDEHKLDKAEGRSHEASRVREAFKHVFTLRELEEARLWERLDTGLADGTAAGSTPSLGEKNDAVAMPPTKGRVTSLEAESLKPSVTSGQVEAQPMGGFAGGKWRGDQQLWWTGGKTGDALTLTFAVNAPGVYRIAASFTRAQDYGMISVTVNGVATKAEKLDLYDTGVTKTGPVPLGDFKLDAGNHRMSITITGSNAAATPSFMVGVDELRFERVE